ncbi:MAG: GtrA family protein [Candidatus Portnoybacteria bacterium]|nr:GtrA family protein [Candidatus Portnoybacteria bacterium]
MNQEITFKKRDFISSLIIGLVVALLVIIALKIGFIEKQIPYLWALIIILPILCSFGLYVAFLIGKKIKIVYQFVKYVLVGGLNTLIDFEILNILMWQSGIYKGEYIILFNAISFVIAITNSYTWNRFWTFKEARESQAQKESVGKEFTQFMIVSLIGLGVNSGLVYLITTYINPFFDLSPAIWANLAKAAATALSLLWNFIGYKFIVFDQKDAAKPEPSIIAPSEPEQRKIV